METDVLCVRFTTFLNSYQTQRSDRFNFTYVTLKNDLFFLKRKSCFSYQKKSMSVRIFDKALKNQWST